MGYVENSYSNSNNGGSVNSQDSIWQLKMSAAASNSANMIPQHNYMDQPLQQNYGYDPMTHGGYGAVDDYAPYPHLMTTASQHGGDDYHPNMRTSQNPSRQDYCSDPYASVHKPKKRMDQHMGELGGWFDKIDTLDELHLLDLFSTKWTSRTCCLWLSC